MGETVFDIATDLKHIRIEQARLLKERATSSAVIVQSFIIIFGLLIAVLVSPLKSLIWLCVSTPMVLVTLIYARFKASQGISSDNFESYLNGHTIICAITGIIWGGYSIYIFDWPVPANFIIAALIPLTITVGGMLPSSAYRRGYLALASCSLFPFAVFLMLTLPDNARLLAIGVFGYFGFGVLSSAQAEINTRDGIIARASQAYTKKLFDKNVEIQKISEEKARFLVGTTHDFSQPLHAQGYYIEALGKSLTTDEQKDFLDKVKSSWKAQRDLLHGLAEITRLDSGAISPNIITFNLKSELAHLVSEFEPKIKRKKIQFSAELKDILVSSDPVLLNRIVRNLLDNAIKFTAAGDAVELLTEGTPDKVILSICDAGPGLTPEEQAHVFEEYYQTLNCPDNTGSGLGLSIVRRLSKLLNLPIELRSEIGVGTRFRLEIPLAKTMDFKEIKQVTPTVNIESNPLVVVIDDDDLIRESMAIELTDLGLQVISAETLDSAISLLSETLETPSLLIIDKRLAFGKSGISAIEALREEVNEDTPAILMTGDVLGFDNVSGLRDVQVMIKPILPSDLRQTISSIVSR